MKYGSSLKKTLHFHDLNKIFIPKFADFFKKIYPFSPFLDIVIFWKIVR